jgi:anti-sigma factor RsiW
MTDAGRPRKTELLRYADGELDGTRAEAVRAYLVVDAEAAREVDALRRLRAAAKRSVLARTPQLSDELRSRMEQLIEARARPALHPRGAARAGPLPPRWRRAAALAVFTGLLAAAALWLWRPGATRQTSSELLGPAKGAGGGTSHQTIAVAVTRKHVICSQMQDHFYDGRFPRVLAELPPVVREHLGASAPVPDLAPLGFDFAGAGACQLPGGTTLHILYRARDNRARHVSVFAQHFTGQVEVSPKGVLLLAGPDAAHPLLCWREGTTLCFLIADDVESFVGARRVLGLAPL